MGGGFILELGEFSANQGAIGEVADDEGRRGVVTTFSPSHHFPCDTYCRTIFGPSFFLPLRIPLFILRPPRHLPFHSLALHHLLTWPSPSYSHFYTQSLGL